MGVPDLLRGREKLNEGRGRAADESEPMDGDLPDRKEPIAGDVTALAKAALPEDSFRGGREWNEPDILLLPSSVGKRGEDMMLDDLLGNSARGGANPNSSKESCFCFPGELLAAVEGIKRVSSCRVGESVWSSWDCVSLCIGEGDRSRRAPKKSEGSASGSLTLDKVRPLEGSRSGMAGTDSSSSGVGGIRLIRGCMETGRLASSENASSSSVLRPNPDGTWSGESPPSEAESWDIERKYSERP